MTTLAIPADCVEHNTPAAWDAFMYATDMFARGMSEGALYLTRDESVPESLSAFRPDGELKGVQVLTDAAYEAKREREEQDRAIAAEEREDNRLGLVRKYRATVTAERKGKAHTQQVVITRLPDWSGLYLTGDQLDAIEQAIEARLVKSGLRKAPEIRQRAV